MTPYAYSFRDLCRDTHVFPNLESAVRSLIDKGFRASSAQSGDHPVEAHVADGSQPADLTPYVERIPVDEAALRGELMQKVADDRAEYTKQYPHGRTGLRMSGDNWLCEASPDELERILRREIEARAWRWKTLPIS